MRKRYKLPSIITLILGSVIIIPILTVLVFQITYSIWGRSVFIEPVIEEFLKFLPVALVASGAGLLGSKLRLKDESHRRVILYVLIAMTSFALVEATISLLGGATFLQRLPAFIAHIFFGGITTLGWFYRKLFLGLLTASALHIGFNLIVERFLTSDSLGYNPLIYYLLLVLLLAITFAVFIKLFRWDRKK